MTKRETPPEAIPAETDDARSIDSPAADRHRDDLPGGGERIAASHERKRRDISDNRISTTKAEIENDARGQSDSNHAGRSNNGVSSAKQSVITH